MQGSLLNRRRGLFIRNNVLLDKQFIHPVTDYACLQSCPEAASATIQLLPTHLGTLGIAKSAGISMSHFLLLTS